MEREEKVVLDASVVTKWYSEEDWSRLALQYREEYIEGEIEIVEPTLVFYEVANALNYNPNFTEVDVKESLDALVDIDLTIQAPTKPIIRRTIDLAKKYGLSIYDSTYLALATDIGTKMVTADMQFWDRIKADPHAQLLSHKS